MNSFLLNYHNGDGNINTYAKQCGDDIFFFKKCLCVWWPVLELDA